MKFSTPGVFGILCSPEVYNDARTSARVNREQSDQDQVTLLKAKAYKALASDFLKRFN